MKVTNFFYLRWRKKKKEKKEKKEEDAGGGPWVVEGKAEEEVRESGGVEVAVWRRKAGESGVVVGWWLAGIRHRER
ncbi:glutathione S-transferase L3-like [Pyrus ussuriensis x Pyrus communis]|uniref:Glutathione S-transferase L3-like n=1 Tax=Pyrus ussuriensis x Pyrus communis TaxID=2448454 RepID=A0A5N5H257_9ROSA|nr:glutathione S-transferase L3-like [Pyrus ussuriensis x Pyrus communis]